VRAKAPAFGFGTPYGIAANRRTLKALVTHLVEQRLLAAQLPVEQLFLTVE
jgi:hypothetical protein